MTSEALLSGWQECLQARTRIIAILALPGTEAVVEMKEAEGLSPDPRPVVKTAGRLDPRSKNAPTRWKIGQAEFGFSCNDIGSAKQYALWSGSFELWDPATGHIAPYIKAHVRLEPGKAQLLLKR